VSKRSRALSSQSMIRSLPHRYHPSARSSWVRILAAALSLSACLVGWVGQVGAQDGNGDGIVGARPNVIVILTDDQGLGDMGRAGELDCNDLSADPANCQHPLETALQAAGLESFTPHIDQLAREGVRFTDFHVTPLCATTRASLLTGRFNQRTGVLFPIDDRQIMEPRETTLAQLFKRAGYRTGMFGKWNLGDDFPARPQDRGFDKVLKTGGSSLSQLSDYWMNDCFGDSYFEESGDAISFGPNNEPPQPGDPYCTDIFFQEAIAFIADHVSHSPGQPFFAYITPTAPHHIQGPLGSNSFAPPNNPDPSVVYEALGVDPVLADFYGAIKGIDDNLGELRRFLQDKGLEENTILVFLGDNGSQLTISDAGTFRDRNDKRQFLWNRYRINARDPGYADFINPAGLRSWKARVYGGGHRVFLLIRWPAGGISSQAIEKIDQLTHVSDLFPTLLGLADVEIPPGKAKKLDGVSLERLLAGDPDPAFDERVAFVQMEIGAQNAETGAFVPRELVNFSVLTPEWRLVHPGENASALYASSDRTQLTNLAAGNPDVVQQLKGQWSDFYASWIGRYDDAKDRGRISIGEPRLPDQTLTAGSWLANASFCNACVQAGIQVLEDATPERGFWALKVLRDGAYSIKLRRWPTAGLAPPSVAEQPIDPRGTGSARLVISPEYFDVDTLSLSETGHNFIDLVNPIDAWESESEFCVRLWADNPRRRSGRGGSGGMVFMGGELTGVREVAPGCDVSVDPASCPAVVRSPYYAEVSYLGEGGCGG
jgi:arylsulfatase A-like enzyme